VCAAYSERRGQSSEDLARALALEVSALRATSAPIGHRTADQLLLPLVLFTRGALLRCQASEDLHFATNAGVIEAFLGSGLVVVSGAAEAASAAAAAAQEAGAGGGGAGEASLHPGVLVTVQPRAYFGAGAAESSGGATAAEAAVGAGSASGSSSAQDAAAGPATPAAEAPPAAEAAAAVAVACRAADEEDGKCSASKRARTTGDED
jgi:hypothetical protein